MLEKVTPERPRLRRQNRQGLCKLPSDAIVKARDDTAAQVNLTLLTFVGTVIFCVLSLFASDSALLVGGEKLNVPLAGPVSFFGFMLLGPAVLIVLRIYLQIYVEHQRRLDRIAQTMPVARTPILMPDKNPLLRSFRGFAFYLLLPLAMFAFWWKAAVFPQWGWILAIVTAAVIAMHLSLLFRKLSWTQRAVMSLVVTILAVAVTLTFGMPLRLCPIGPPLCLARSFNLFRANLSDQWLPGKYLENANLGFVNLSGANFDNANLSGADLRYAKLNGAYLNGANLNGANLGGVKLNGAYLNGAKLNGAKLNGADLGLADLSAADLSGADLSGANHLSRQQLDTACGDANTKLPTGLTVKF